jgi:uncharacterized protein (DUF736 family)
MVLKTGEFKSDPPDESRLITGFFSQLSDEQKEHVLSYEGEENHGDPSFRLEPHSLRDKEVGSGWLKNENERLREALKLAAEAQEVGMYDEARRGLQSMVQRTGVFELSKPTDPIAEAAALLRANGWRVEEPKCEACTGTGKCSVGLFKSTTYRCPDCNGTGARPQSRAAQSTPPNDTTASESVGTSAQDVV